MEAPQVRQAQKQATQARILEVARLHFERHGFEAASIRAIAVDADVAAGTVMLHFTDKLGLLHAALHDDLEEAILRCLTVKNSGGLLLDCLCAIAEPFYAYYAARPTLSKILLRESMLAEPPWRERFTDQVKRVNVHVVRILEEAKERNEIARETSGPLLAAAFFSFYYFALIGWVQAGIDNPMLLFKSLMGQQLSGLTVVTVSPAPTTKKKQKKKKKKKNKP